MLQIIEQMPTANENYLVNWDDDLASIDSDPPDIIASWSVQGSSSDFTVTKDSNTNDTTTMRITGGQPDTFYTITVTIVTAGGNTIPRVIPFHCMKAVYLNG